jgi:type I restriction enzyme, S subunit
MMSSKFLATYPTELLGNLAQLVKRPMQFSGDSAVQSLGVKWYGRGAYVAEEKSAIELRADRFEVHANDLIYNDMWARNGSVAIVPEELHGCVASAHFPTWELDLSRVYPPFLSWYFQTPRFWADCEVKSQGSTGRNAITKTLFRKLEIPLPHPDEQRRIVAQIEAYAAAIEEAKGLRQAAVAEVDALIASEEMRIWSEDKLQSAPVLADLTTYLARGRQSRQGDSDHFLVKTQHVQMGEYVPTTIRLAPDVAQKVSSDATVQYKDTLICCSAAGCLGRVAMYADSGRIVSTDTHVAIARANTDLITPEYLYAYLKGAQGQLQLRSRERGDWQREKVGFRLTELNMNDLRQVPVPLPTLDEQKQVVTYLDNLHAGINELRRLQAETAAELDALLPSILDRAFKGEL